MPLLDRDQRGPVAAMTAVALAAFGWVVMMAWYIGEVAIGKRRMCTGSVCPTDVPAAIVYVRIAIWFGLIAAIVTALYFGRQWLLEERGPRRLAIAAGVAGFLLIAFVVLAVLWPPTWQPPAEPKIGI